MSQTILIESNTDLRKLFSINLNTYAGTDVIDRDNATDTIALLKILPSIDLIITTVKVDTEYTAIDIHKFIVKNNLDIPMIVLGDSRELNDKVLCLKEPIDWEVLIKHSSTLLGITEEEVRKKIVPNFVPVSMRYFYEIDHTPCDVYIRIKKGSTDFEYVKRLHSQDSFDSEDIAKYEKQGLKEFYIPRDYQQYFVNFVSNNLIQKLEDQNLGFEDRLNLNSTSYEVVKDRIINVGLDDSIQEISQSCIKSMISTVKTTPKLASLLKMLLSSKISYAYQKAHLVSVIGDFILSKQSWYEEKHLDILTYVAFFSDISLKSVKQIQINSEHELINSGLSEVEIDEVNNHAKAASDIITGTPLYSEYLQLVLLQHQGSEDGIGFPDSPSEDVHPIAKVYMIADAFVKTMLNPNAPKNKKDILTILYARFPNRSYQKVIRTLEQKID
jgi:HD-GYP domain-containing protein (c-di-GMP phosphodiesterase class II)